MHEGDPHAGMTAAFAEHGLILRGGLSLPEGEGPAGPSGKPARTVMLVGQAGAATWPHFVAWRARQAVVPRDPYDSWAREIIGRVADRYGARAVSPSDRPYLPFQQWAMRAEGLKPSPLGILMHPRFGLWHAYRGALLLDTDIPLTPINGNAHLCDSCTRKPCLKACPVDAYSASGFDHRGCVRHVKGDGLACRSGGCLDRNACPEGAGFRYPADVQAFHMAAFVAAAPREVQ